MTRTCPYCGTKIKYSAWCTTPQKEKCPTCGNNPFHPVLKQLRTANIGLTILNVVVFILNILKIILDGTIPERTGWWLYCGLVLLTIQGIALLLLPILQYYLTRDCYVQKMYELEQGWWVES